MWLENGLYDSYVMRFLTSRVKISRYTMGEHEYKIDFCILWLHEVILRTDVGVWANTIDEAFQGAE